MRRKILNRLAAAITGLSLIGGVAILLAPTAAFADGGVQHFYEDSYDINAWNGGPLIKAYAGNNSNDDFMVVINEFNESDVNLYFWGTGPYSGYCIGDYNNLQGDARADIIQTCGSPDEIPWGGNFQIRYCSGNQIAFYNTHWNAYLAPASNSNGAQFYLNGSEVCYNQAPA